MVFTPEQKAKAEKFLASVKCPICGSNHIQFTDEATQILAYKGDFQNIDFSRVSWLHAFCGVCKNCGFIMQFSVVDVIK